MLKVVKYGALIIAAIVAIAVTVNRFRAKKNAKKWWEE